MNLCVERAGLHIREEKFLGNLSSTNPPPSTMELVHQELALLCSECLALIKKEYLREITHYQGKVTTALGCGCGDGGQTQQPPITQGRQRPLGEGREATRKEEVRDAK